jgi:hypothetical protein
MPLNRCHQPSSSAPCIDIMPGFSYPAPVGHDVDGGGQRNENDEEGNTGPTVGSDYNGSKVIDVQVEVTDRGARVRKRSIIKLENGVIMKEDHWKDKIFQEVDAPRRRAPVRPKSLADNDTNPAMAPSIPAPSRSMGPKTKSGRQLPKPAAPPRRVTQGTAGALPPIRSESPARGNVRRRSRGDDFIREPVRATKSSDLEELQVSSHNHRGFRSSSREAEVSTDRENRDLSPEPSSKPSSFRNMSNFLISPIRQAPAVSKSADSLDAMRASLHSPGSKRGSQLPPKGDVRRGRRTSATGGVGDINEDGAPQTPQNKPRSLKLGVLISPRLKPTRSRSGDLEKMQDGLPTADEQSKSEPFKLERRPSLATPESNREKLRSFKALIAMPSPKRSTRSPSPAAIQREQEQNPRRGSFQQGINQQSPEKSPSSRRGSTSRENVRAREPSLSPEEVKKPASSSYITSFLDTLYDSYVDPKGGNDGDSDDDGYGGGLLESSLNKFVEWAE